MEKQDKISDEKLENYFKITKESIEIIKKSVAKCKEKEAEEVIEMASAYLGDAEYFRKKGDYVNCLASLSYAYGWIDCAARLGVFSVSDRKRFTV